MPVLRDDLRTAAISLRQRLHRRLLPREYKHRWQVHPRFGLTGDAANGREVTLGRRTLGRTGGWAGLRDSRGGECFIVCSGPSLDGIDFAALEGRACLAVNGAVRKFREHGFAPAAHVCVGVDFFQHRFDLVRAAVGSGAMGFYSFGGISRIAEREPGLLRAGSVRLLERINRHFDEPRLAAARFDTLAEADPALELHPAVRGQSGRVGFSRDAARGVFCARTVAFCAAQVAYHLGYRTLHFLGLDLGGPRFYEAGAGARPSTLEKDFGPYIRPGFEVLGGMCRRGELEAYNLSPASRLPGDVIPLRDAAEVLGGQSTKQRPTTGRRAA